MRATGSIGVCPELVEGTRITGRFLTRDAKPGQSNPYIPYDPIGALVAPLGLLSLYYSRKKNPGKLGMWFVLLIVVGSVGMSLFVY